MSHAVEFRRRSTELLVHAVIVLDDVVPLASGGTANLFTARVGDERVVIKVARDDRIGANAALASEAALLASGRVACGPRLLAQTRVADRDAIVLEHISLPTLRTVTTGRRAGDPIALAIALCHSVAELHAAGIVHADLTPDNILIDVETRTIRLIDFGLAAPVGETVCELASVGYAGPERLDGVCPAATTIDVYSLGVIAYELLAGAPPFAGSLRERRLQHVVRRVPRVSEHVTVPAAVDDAIAAAMAKSPAARPRDAMELAARLARSGPAVVAPVAAETATTWLVGLSWSGDHGTLREAIEDAGAAVAASTRDRHVLAVAAPDRAERLACRLRGAGATAVDVVAGHADAIRELVQRQPGTATRRCGELVGREPVLAAVAAAEQAAAAGSSRLVTIWGEVGTGKSRIADAIVAQASLRTVAIAAPTVADLVARVTTWEALAPIDQAVLGTVMGRSVAPEPLAAAPGAIRQRAAHALARALVACAPAVIVVDDAHDADPIVLDALELATLDAATGLAIIALARPALASTRARWSRRAATPEWITLAPLVGEHGRALIRTLLPSTAAVPGAALDRIVERCGGVPLYIVELVGAVLRAAEGPATRGALPTDLLDLPLHDAVAWSVAADLSGLAPATRSVVEALAVAGRPLAPLALGPFLAALNAAGVRIELDASAALRQLAASELVVERHGTVSFRHDIVRDAVAARVEPARRVAIHRAMLASGLATTPAERAHHADCAGDRGVAALAWREAARFAIARHDDLGAERALGRAIAGERDVELLRQRGAARSRLGRYDAAARDFADARALAHELADRGAEIDVLLDEATALDWSLHHGLAAACVADVLALARADEPALRRARIAMAEGRRAWRSGDGGAAIEPLRRAIALADPAGGDGYETAIASRLMLGCILGARGETDAAAAILDEALVEASARHDIQHVVAARANRFVVHAARGDAEALRDDMAYIAIAGRELGVAVTEYRGELYQALVALWCGEDARASVHASRARQLEASDGALFPRPAAALVLAELAARAGDRDETAQRVADARAHGTPNACDAVVLDGLDAWLADRLDPDALAARAIAIGEPETAYELLEIAARTAERRGDTAMAANVRAAIRTIPNLPRFIASGAT